MKLYQARATLDEDGSILAELSAFGNPHMLEAFQGCSYSLSVRVIGEMLAIAVLLTPDGKGDEPVHEAERRIERLEDERGKLEETVNAQAQKYAELATKKKELLSEYERAHDYSLASRWRKMTKRPPALASPASFR